MKQYISVNGGDVFIEYDPETKQSRTIILSDLVRQKEDIENRLAGVTDPTDEELLNWAKLNFPRTDYGAERLELDRINTILISINGN